MRQIFVMACSLIISVIICAYDAQGNQLTEVRLLSGGHYTAYLNLDVAEYQGIFRDMGIPAKVQVVKGGTNQAIALLSGEGEFAFLGPEHSIKAQLQGKQLVFVGLVGQTPTQMLVASKSRGIKRPEELKSKKVAVSSLGSLGHMMLLAILEKYGLGSRDVEIIPMEYAAAAAAIDKGAIDGAILLDPMATQFVQSGKGIVLYDLVTAKGVKELFGMDYPASILTTTKAFYASHPDTCRKVLDALMKANKYIADTPPEKIAESLPREVVGDRETFILGVTHARDYFTTSPEITPAMIQLVEKSMKAVGAVPKDTTIDISAFFPAWPTAPAVVEHQWKQWGWILGGGIVVLLFAIAGLLLLRSSKR